MTSSPPRFWPPVLGFVLSLVLGILFQSWVGIKSDSFLLLALSSILFFTLAFIIAFFFLEQPQPKKYFLMIPDRTYWWAIAAGFFFLGALLYLRDSNRGHELPFGKIAFVEGCILSNPEKILGGFSPRSRVFFELSRWQEESKNNFCSYRVYLSGKNSDFNSATEAEAFQDQFVLNDGDGIAIGTRIKAQVFFAPPRGPAHWGHFNLVLRAPPKILAAPSFSKDQVYLRLRIFLEHLKAHWGTLIDAHLSQDNSALAKTLLLGERGVLDRDAKEIFVRSGTAHLLAISGLHVGIIGLLIWSVLRALRFPLRAASAGTVLILWMYAVLVGLSPSIFRASFLATFLLSCFILRRENSFLNALGWAALITLILRPLDLFNLGFQLSYATVLGMTLLAPSFLPQDQSAFLEKVVGQKIIFGRLRITEKFVSWLMGAVASSLAAYLVSLPWTTNYFYLFNPIAILANLILIPWSFLVLASGISFLILGSFSVQLATILSASFSFFLSMTTLFSEIFSRVGTWRVPPLDSLWICGYFCVLLLIALRRDRFISAVKIAILSLLLLNALVWPRVWAHSSNAMKVHFIDVGQGDAALLELPRRGTVLIDSGPLFPSDSGRWNVAPYLWQRGITRLDLVIITHPHQDHYGGLEYLRRHFDIGQILDNGQTSVHYQKMFAANAHAWPQPVYRDSRIVCEDPQFDLTVLYPDKNADKKLLKNPNNSSLVMKMRYGKDAALFCGDVESLGMSQIVSQYAPSFLQADLLKVAHHGSDEGSVARAFYGAVQPRFSVISAGIDNSYGLPNTGTLHLLEQLRSQIFRTDRDGSIQFQTDGNGVWVY